MSFATQWLSATAGATIVVNSGDYPRETFKPSKRPKGSAPVRILGVGQSQPRFLQDPAVGSTDTLNLKSGVRDLILENIYFQVDDRAGILTEAPDGTRKASLIGCTLEGIGYGPYDPAWKNDSKWGQLHNRTAAWSEIGTVTRKVFKEHARYFHTIQGNHAFSRCVSEWCGRTAYQFVARMKESGTPQPVGKGDVTILDDTITDVCLENTGGGYAISFKGGMPESRVTIERSKIRLGCDPKLDPKFGKNISGCFLSESAPESAPGAGDAAHPGGTMSFTVIEPDWEVGTVYQGYGSAKRSLAKIGATERFRLDWGDAGRIVQNGGNGIALEIFNSCDNFYFSGTPAEFRGKVKYKGTTYPDWRAFAKSHPECAL